MIEGGEGKGDEADDGCGVDWECFEEIEELWESSEAEKGSHEGGVGGVDDMVWGVNNQK